MNSIGIIAFSILMMIFALLHFFVFARGHENFMRLWGAAWTAYALSLFLLHFYYVTDDNLFLQIRKMLDMTNMLLLLLGTYLLIHRKIPGYWYRFSLYMVLFAGICIVYDVDLLSFYLPISVFQLGIAFFAARNLYARWDVDLLYRLVTSMLFFFWGGAKAALSVGEVFLDISSNFFLIEVILGYIVCFTTLTIYSSYIRYQSNMTNDMYSTIVENSHDVMFCYRLEPSPMFLYMSPSVKDLTGYSPNEFYTNPRLIQNITVESFAGDVADLFEGRLKRNEYPALELYRKSGTKFWCEFQYAFTKDKDGESNLMVGTMRDVTDMKSAEVERANDTRRRNILLSYISHELRTPITSIAGFLTAIQDGTMDSESDKAEAMDIILSKTLTMKKLIDDLDQLSKFDANQVTFNYEMFTAGEVAEALINRNVPDAERSGFTVSVTADIKKLSRYWLVIDLERINQVISNLISNAIKYSGKSRFLQLKLVIDDREEFFMVSVKDHGVGIKDAQMSYIFDRFYRVGYNREVDASGHGLGLTLSKEIIEAHRGEIYVESEYGYGSTFTFTIPLYKEE